MTIGPEPMISILCMSLRFGTAVSPSLVRINSRYWCSFLQENQCVVNLYSMPLAQPLRLFYRREKQGSTLILKDIATDFHEAYSVVPPPFEFRLEILAGRIDMKPRLSGRNPQRLDSLSKRSGVPLYGANQQGAD